jgi:PPM family protein phosphatase
LEIQIAMLSEIGRRERNEDACGFWRNGGAVCCVLSDGAGGHGGGDVASRLAVNQILEGFSAAPDCAVDAVRELIAAANRKVIGEQSAAEQLHDMRATVVVFTLDPIRSLAVWGHVGDSRLYCLRNGYVHVRTKDHSLVQSMIDAGLADRARLGGPDRSVLLASLGGEEGFEPDLLDPPLAVRPGDAFLMCSDGFWENVPERSIEATLQRAVSPEHWLELMQALVQAADRSAQDNYSAIAVWCGAMDFTTRARTP